MQSYENTACCQTYETLLQYKYLVRPPQLEPLLLTEMPTRSEDGLTYHFKLKPGVFFHDDPCFPGGKGRELVSSDVFYSWKRMADQKHAYKNWWLLENTIAGFDEFKERQNAEGVKVDYDAPVEGLQIVNDREFKVILKESVTRFEYVLAMFQTSIVPREAVEKYGSGFPRHPVGTGPYMLENWEINKKMVFVKNPKYHECYYPDECMPEDRELGLDQAAGQRLPITDRLEISMFVDSQPMWLEFRVGNLDYTTVPAENFPTAFVKRSKRLRKSWREEGIRDAPVELLDFIFIGFNMEDDLLGGYTEQKKALRQAISLAMNWEERNDAFYNGINKIYDGPIPPGLSGYPPDGVARHSYRGPNLQQARELLAKAGYPGGKGLPELDYYTGRGANSDEQVEMLSRQLAKIGVKINPHLVEFSTLMEVVNNRKAPMFSFAWGSDYPDAENNLALFYSKNASPGSNHFNYNRAEYDKLYEQVRLMPPSPEREALYVKMRDMLIEDTPFLGSMARTRFYLINPQLKNCKPSEDFQNWYKYLDVSYGGQPAEAAATAATP